MNFYCNEVNKHKKQKNGIKQHCTSNWSSTNEDNGDPIFIYTPLGI
jgi:hypothetical protein